VITQPKITLDGKRTDYRLDKFTFKLDKTKKAKLVLSPIFSFPDFRVVTRHYRHFVH
jgi:hypothetical protein